MATDWTALKVEYITTSTTLRDLADKHGIKAAGVMRRAAKEQWDTLRKQESAKVSRASLEASLPIRVSELEKFNADDLRMARAIRAAAAKLLGKDSNSAQDLRALAGAVDVAQKVGRLALGAATDISAVTTRELPASIEEFV